MIRDLRAAPPYLPNSPSLAFARGLITEPATTDGRDTPARTRRAFTIAVTSPRLLTCKRGLAAHLAAQLAIMGRADDETVCVVDADVESRDIGARFGVTSPVLLDVAKMMGVAGTTTQVEQIVSRVDPPGLSVLPTRPPEAALLPLLQSKTATLLGPLATAFDYLVVDAPVGLGVEAPERDRAVLDNVDALVVAVAADPATFGSALRYLSALGDAVRRGSLPSTFEIHIVLTGSDVDGSRSLLDEDGLERKLEGLPVIGAVPQLWGRQRPNGPFDLDLDVALRERLTDIARTIIAFEPPTTV
jgi:MinD-like ATPase involved in chromosome partitioning or flagellar assembly